MSPLSHNILLPVVRLACENRDQIFILRWAIIPDKRSGDNESRLYNNFTSVSRVVSFESVSILFMSFALFKFILRDCSRVKKWLEYETGRKTWVARCGDVPSYIRAQRRLKLACASVQSDQSLLSAWKKLCNLGYPKCTERRFWSDCANAQADQNLN